MSNGCANPTCTATVNEESYRADLHHIIPIMSGGVHDSELLIPLCRSCHHVAENYMRKIAGEYFEPLLIDYTHKELPDGRLPSDEFQRFCTAISQGKTLQEEVNIR